MKLEIFTELTDKEQLETIENYNPFDISTPFYVERLYEALNGHPESLCFLDERLTKIYKRLKK
jgi:hypothetical protein